VEAEPRPNHQAYLNVLRRMTDEQKLNKVVELSEFTRDLFLAGLRERFPAASEAEIRRIYLERFALCHNRNW
jgi:hypothetical protein